MSPDVAAASGLGPRSQVLRALACAIVVATLVGFGLSLTIALLALRLHDLGFSAHAIGFNTAAGGVATLVSAPFITRAVSHVGVAGLLVASLLVGGVAIAAFTLTNDYTTWVVLRFVVGAAVTAMFVLSEFWISSVAPARHRGLAIGVYVTSLAIGFAAGPLTLLVTGTAGNLPFYVAGVLFFGATIPLALNMEAAPSLEGRHGRGLLVYFREAPAATLAALLHGAIEVAGLSLLPIYALRSGASVRDGALFASLFIVGNSALQLPIGAIADCVDRGRLLIVLAVVGLGGAVGLALLGTSSIWVFEVALLVWGGIVGAFYPIGLAELGARFRGADLASANSAYVMAYATGMLIGPPLVGEGLDLLPPSGFFVVIAAMIAAYLVVAGARFGRRTTLRSQRRVS